MKKIYMLMICLMHLTSLWCMEKPRKENLFAPYTEDSNAFALTTFTPTPDYHHTPLTANEPGWEKLNEIAYIKNTHLSSLEPITQYTTSWIKKTNKEEQKPIIESIIKSTIESQLELAVSSKIKSYCSIIKNLYDEAHNFAQKYRQQYRYKFTYDSLSLGNKDIILLLKSMSNAYRDKINEDMMGNFSYIQGHTNKNDCLTILLFSCLKKYRLDTQNNQELLPPDNHHENKEPKITKNIQCDLARILNIPVTKTIICQVSPADKLKTSADTRKTYPSYYRLTDLIDTLFNCNSRAKKDLITYFYADEQKWLQYSPSGIYDDLNNFCRRANSLIAGFKKAYYPMCEGKEALYELLQVIENTIKSKKLLSEKDLAISVLTSSPSFWDNLFYIKETIESKNKISIICALIEKYNKNRKEKKTPLPQQFRCYRLITDRLPLMLPDSFNSALLDKNHYAFEEFQQLIDDIEALARANDTDIQECVTYLYGKHDS